MDSAAEGDQPLQEKYFLVEHMEEFLYDWCKAEYLQMLKYVQNTNFRIIFSNFDSNFDFVDDKNGQNNKENLKEFLNSNKDLFKSKASFVGKELVSYLEKDEGCFHIPLNERKEKLSGYLKSGEHTEGKPKSDVLKVPFKRVCLLDMRAEKTLEPSDLQEFDVLLFGGILGDHPPRDRTYVLRKHNYGMRNLGKMQMSTDTALLTCKLILHNKLRFEEIPFIDEPEIFDKNENGVEQSIVIEGFRYIIRNIYIK